MCALVFVFIFCCCFKWFLKKRGFFCILNCHQLSIKKQGLKSKRVIVTLLKFWKNLNSRLLRVELDKLSCWPRILIIVHFDYIDYKLKLDEKCHYRTRSPERRLFNISVNVKYWNLMKSVIMELGVRKGDCSIFLPT